MWLIGALSDASGLLRAPGLGAWIWIALVLALAAMVAYSDWRKRKKRVK
jgi:hypothetical protein